MPDGVIPDGALVELRLNPHALLVLTDRRPAADARQAEAGEQIWPEAPGNLAFDWTAPADPSGDNRREIERIFAGAAHVARASLVNQRIAAVSMEPRIATASYDAKSDRYTLRCPGLGPLRLPRR